MADVVGAFGVPHTPVFPFFVERDGPECETAKLFARMRGEIEALRPDLIVMFDTDHLNTFFFDNLPILAIGTADMFQGPNDEVRGVPMRDLKSMGDVARHIHTHVVTAGFDVASLQKYTVDHSVVVPLHFMTPQFNVPVIPIFISGHLPPLPAARRAYAFGQAVRKAIESWPGKLRVVTMGSGSFSLEVWGPRIAPGRSDGVTDPAWVTRVCGLLEKGDIETLLNEATPEQMAKAGNVGGELLDWIAMLGTIDARPAKFITPQMQNGHAYAVWS